MGRKKVLIADDNEINRVLIKEMLKDNYDIIEAKNGLEAISIIESNENDIDLLLLDLNMPELDGIGVLDKMNKEAWIENIPVIIISSESSPDFIKKAYDLGAEDFISRPFNYNIVSRRIKNAIILHSKQKQLINEVSNQFIIREKQNNMMISILSHIVEYRNGESGAHVLHINIITGLLLEALLKKTDKYNITKNEINIIRNASSFHDIGKIEIPSEILNKPGRLTVEEFEIMKKHSEIGYTMIENVESYKNEPLVKYAREICRWHHERYDGKGYPDHLIGDEIPISAQVVSIADVYDALTSERCYKKAFSHEKAIEMINNNECGVFNPLLIECLNENSDKLKAVSSGYSLENDNQSFNLINDILDDINKRSIDTSGNIRLLKEDKNRYEIFNQLTDEMWVEYFDNPSLMILNKAASSRLNLPERIENPLSNSLLIKTFGLENIRAYLNELYKTDNEGNFDFYFRSKKMRFKGRVLWNIDRDGIKKISVAIMKISYVDIPDSIL